MNNIASDGFDRLLTRSPEQSSDVRRFNVNDEMILITQDESATGNSQDQKLQALSLNQSSCIIWDLCDGVRSLQDIINSISNDYHVPVEQISGQVLQVISELGRLNMIRLPDYESGATQVKPTLFTIGIEDKVYFRWQTAIFLESLRGKLPAGWRTLVVVCNGEKPISNELQRILDAYQTDYVCAKNHAEVARLDIGHNGGEFHCAFNRVEALAKAAERVEDDELICLLDSDIFLHGDINFDIMPQTCAMPRNWHIDTDRFFSTVGVNDGKGVDLRMLLRSLGCEQEFKPGGVNVFVTAEVAKSSKFIADCFRFGHALFLLGRTAGAKLTWIAEMPSFALAMTANSIPYELLENEEFLVSSCDEKQLKPGTFYHYYSDPRDDAGRGGFHSSQWCKQDYHNHSLLDSDLAALAHESATDHQRYFSQLAKASKDRIDA